MANTTFTGKGRFGLLLCLTGLLTFSTTTRVRADDSRGYEQDPPSRVARLSYFDGSVSLQHGGSGDWGAAARNRPVTVGDKLWADKDARAELQAGQASIHIGAMTALSFLNLDQNITQMRLAEGSVNFRVRELREGDQYEIDTPNAAFTVRQ
ncbi:MAG: FecR domain-containing protein, partial [Acidobacteriota bacterium]|nr:FecR domain-containing protein [Acidobacteriota bacterium]